MHIAIDARLNAYRQGGIPQYTRQLLTALAEVARDDRITSLQHRDQLRPLAVAPNVVRRTILTPPHHRFEQWTLPLELLLVRPDVLHCPDFIAPVRRPCPAVVTIHDLAFLHYPEILDDAARAYYGQVTHNAPRADGIIAVSEATRQDIAQFLDIPIEEISVIYEAPAPLYGRLELRPGEARVLNGIPVVAGSFMLFVSTLEPRKNLPTLLKALRICLDRRPDRAYLLVVAGARGWRDELIFETVRDLRLGDHVLFAGRVGQYDLRWLYNACRFYLNPSLYEGFGLPLLEAMACGAACLAAATSSLPEIGGEAAIYIPPLDAGLWAEAIEELWDDEERQAELGHLGRIQAQRFSWLRAARETLKVYERAIERARPTPTAPVYAPQQAPALPAEPPLAAEPSPAAPRAAAIAGDLRACLRCGTAMLAGQLQRSIRIKRPAAPPDRHPLAPRVWACPGCGHVELVIEQVEAIGEKLGDVAALAETLAPDTAELAAPALAADDTTGLQPAPADQAMVEDTGRPEQAEAFVDAPASAPEAPDEAERPVSGGELAEAPPPGELAALPPERQVQPAALANGEPMGDEPLPQAVAETDSAAIDAPVSPNGGPEQEQAVPEVQAEHGRSQPGEGELLEPAQESGPLPAPTPEAQPAEPPPRAKRRQTRSKRKRS